MWDRNENKRQAVEVVVDQVYFADSKNATSASASTAPDDFGPPPPARSSYAGGHASDSYSAPASTASSFGYSSGAAEDFEEVSDDRRGSAVLTIHHPNGICIYDF